MTVPFLRQGLTPHREGNEIQDHQPVVPDLMEVHGRCITSEAEVLHRQVCSVCFLQLNRGTEHKTNKKQGPPACL